MSNPIRTGVLLTLLAASAVGWAESACTVAAKDTFTTQVDVGASATQSFAGDFRSQGVSTVIEKHCGSLDCHGNAARNMKIYSSGGLRLPNEAGAAPGQSATTLEEITANYLSIADLEPEQLTQVRAHGADPYSLLLIKKPLELERHKGGPAITRGDDAEACLISWLKSGIAGAVVDKNSCTKGANFPSQ